MLDSRFVRRAGVCCSVVLFFSLDDAPPKIPLLYPCKKHAACTIETRSALLLRAEKFWCLLFLGRLDVHYVDEL